jgi:diguanylate cyclase (GGDEF)-like protein
MGAAAFVLAINLFITCIFAAAFGTVAAYARSALGARWLALGYGVGAVHPILEFFMPYQSDPRPGQVAIFAVFLFANSLIVIGLARHYRLAPPWRTLGVVVSLSLVANIFTLDMPHEALLRGALYQSPYFTVQMVGVAILLRNRQRQALDLTLLVLLALNALQFLAKPFLAAALGAGGSPQGYLSSTYAAISQTMGAVLLIANGLLMLLVIMRDAMAEMTARSETDKLSGLLNRRGFEDRGESFMFSALRTGLPGSLIVADLDHFKAINDNHGHGAGDRVIAAFAETLRAAALEQAILGRIGGEEFAVFIPGVKLAGALHYAEGVRDSFSSLSIAQLGPGHRLSASFGVAELHAEDSLSDLLRRADAALYQAKQHGRNRVCTSEPDMAPAPAPVNATARRRGSRQAQA